MATYFLLRKVHGVKPFVRLQRKNKLIAVENRDLWFRWRTGSLGNLIYLKTLLNQPIYYHCPICSLFTIRQNLPTTIKMRQIYSAPTMLMLTGNSQRYSVIIFHVYVYAIIDLSAPCNSTIKQLKTQHTFNNIKIIAESCL